MQDFDALASSLAVGDGDVRGCLILSRDGLVLGSSPADAEATLSPARIRFAALGDVERGFAQVGAESWCFVRRGPYAAFAIAGPGARPGLVLDQMDRALLVAEEGRARHERGARQGEAAPPPTTRSRTLLHPDANHGEESVLNEVLRTPAAPKAREDQPPVSDRDLGFGLPSGIFDPGVLGRVGDRVAAQENEPAAVPTVPGSQAESSMPEAEGVFDPEDNPAPEPDLDLAEPIPPGNPTEPGPPAWDGGPAPWEPEADEPDAVDRFSLAREFRQLLQRNEDPADG